MKICAGNYSVIPQKSVWLYGEALRKFGAASWDFRHGIWRFFREFTRFQHFPGRTNPAFLHTHYFLLGMLFFLILLAPEKVFSFSDRAAGNCSIAYQTGLHITDPGFLLRGLTQVLDTELNRGMNDSISGITEVGPMGASIVLLLLKVRKRAA